MPTVFAITVSYGRCHDSPTCAWAPRWNTYGRSARVTLQLAHEVVDRRLVRQVGEVHLQPAAEVADVVERAARRGAHERMHVGSDLDERVGQMRPHEAVGARHQHGAAAERVAELLAEIRDVCLGPDAVGRHA